MAGRRSSRKNARTVRRGVRGAGQRRQRPRFNWPEIPIRKVLLSCGVIVGLASVLLTFRTLRANVEARLVTQVRPRLEFSNVPRTLRGLADTEVSGLLRNVMRQAVWTDPRLCEALWNQASASAWINRVENVRRRADGVFVVDAVFRTPVALVAHANGFALVDGEGVRLPGSYAYHPSWKVIRGVRLPVPKVGHAWTGDDLAAALDVLRAIADEPFARQITAVIVDNYQGRNDPMACHIELATDRAGGRIRWGSAPGRELEENSVEQKLALLRAAYQATGRVDADYPVIDITTFPDRFTVPDDIGGPRDQTPAGS